MATEHVTQLAIKQAEVIFAEIADQAAQLDRVCYHYSPDATEYQPMNELVILLRRQIAQLGMLADMGSQKLGGGQVNNVEGWLLPPVYPRAQG